jgi:transcriptional regulator with XRE-family HTH domain
MQIDAEKLQRLRRDTGLSIEAFAAEAGVSDQTVRRWEAGMRHQRTPRVTRLKRVTDTLSRLLGRQILPSDLLVRPEDPTTAEENAAAA